MPASLGLSKSRKIRVPAPLVCSKSRKIRVPAPLGLSKSRKIRVPAPLGCSKSRKIGVPAPLGCSKSCKICVPATSQATVNSTDKLVVHCRKSNIRRISTQEEASVFDGRRLQQGKALGRVGVCVCLCFYLCATRGFVPTVAMRDVREYVRCVFVCLCYFAVFVFDCQFHFCSSTASEN